MIKEGGWADVLGEGRLPRFILICLGVWLNAADSLVTATIMPSVGRGLGGYAYFGWATAGYLLGAVLAGASAGVLAHRFGLRRATAAAAGLYALGCVMSAAGPDIATFLVGRLLQGVGGGWVVGFCSVAIGLMFPGRTLPRVYAAVTSVWGVASLLGPLIGGIFADAGAWRWVFWSFAAQALAVAWAALALLPRTDDGDQTQRIAWGSLGLIALGVAAIAIADIAGRPSVSLGLIVFGLALMMVAVRRDARQAVRLLPRSAGDLRSVPGSGYAAMFLITCASMGYSVYGPAILQTLAGLSALSAGYVIALEAVAWSTAGLMVAHLTGVWPGRMIRLGVAVATLGILASAMVFPSGSVLGAGLAGVILGGGFGLSSAFMNQRLLAALPDAERGMGAAAMSTVRQTGNAAGAAMAAAVANLSGVAHGFTKAGAASAGLWVFVAAAPAALAGVAAAWRLGRDHPAT